MEQAARKGWYDRIILDLGRQMRWSFVPPLMVYLAYGVSTLTAIVGTFFVKDYLGLSAAFLAGLGFWAGIPWALKMPLGHLVDLMWRWKSLLIFVGAALISASLGIMYQLITRPDAMGAILPPGSWYVMSGCKSTTWSNMRCNRCNLVRVTINRRYTMRALCSIRVSRVEEARKGLNCSRMVGFHSD